MTSNAFTYIFDIKSNNFLVDSMMTDNLAEGQRWSEKNTLEGDLVVISEAYEGADGHLDVTDHVASYYIDS